MSQILASGSLLIYTHEEVKGRDIMWSGGARVKPRWVLRGMWWCSPRHTKEEGAWVLGGGGECRAPNPATVESLN